LASALIRFALESAMDLQFTAILQVKFSEFWIPSNILDFAKFYGALCFLLLYAIFAAFIFVKIVQSDKINDPNHFGTLGSLYE
jgi:hypothetical protein